MEDFNHAMLRAIYAFYLFFFILLAFTMGLALLPFGYLAALFIKIRVLYNKKLLFSRHEALMSKFHSQGTPVSQKAALLSLISFFFFGWVVLFI